jgi:hypothetical protein
VTVSAAVPAPGNRQSAIRRIALAVVRGVPYR